MSVAEILAAARAADGKGGGAGSAAQQPSAETAAGPAAEPSAPAPVAAAAASNPAAGGARPSVADILAMARAKKAAADAPAAKPTPPPAAAKPAAAAKPTAKPAVPKGAPKTGVQRDTASILAAARVAAKPGPVSKAEAPPRPAVKPREPSRVTTEKVAAPKPAAVPPKPLKPVVKKAESEAEDRRGFLQLALGSSMALGFTALTVTGGLFSLGLARFLFPNVLAEPPSKFKVGFKDAFPSGKVETKFVPQYGVWVVNGDVQGQQQIYALKTVCTHLGCTPSWLEAEQKFKCPCHGSGFYKDGINFEGPAPRPLERYAIRTADDGQLEIDKSRSFQEELGQWADPDSYVTV